MAFVVDPTITPKLNGDWSITNLGISAKELEEIYHTEEFVGNVGEFCAPVSTVDEDVLEGYSCSAGHTLAYISPFARCFPACSSPCPAAACASRASVRSGGIPRQLTELRSVHVRDLHTCSHCTHVGLCSRCPGLAYMEGDFRGPSSQDCEKSYARTGVPSAAQWRQAVFRRFQRSGPDYWSLRAAS